MNDRVREFINAHFTDLLNDLARLVSVPSVYYPELCSPQHPFGPDVSRALAVFLDIADNLGFRTENIDNTVGYAEMGEGSLFGILAHLDVVPEGNREGWIHPPFELTVDGDKVYGRGVNDDKGAAVSTLYAVAALVNSGIGLKRRFRIIVGLDEESGFRCMERYRQSEEIPEAGFSPDAYFPVVNGEKGMFRLKMSSSAIIQENDSVESAELFSIVGGTRVNVVPDRVTISFRHSNAALSESLRPLCEEVILSEDSLSFVIAGKSAHAMEPWAGENAIQKFLASVDQIDFGPSVLREELLKLRSLFNMETDGASLGIACCDDLSGALSCNLGLISLADGELSVTCDIRYPVTADGESILECLSKSASSIGWKTVIAEHKKPLYVAPDSVLVEELLNAYEAVTGERGEPFAIGGGTYSRAMPNTVSFGIIFPGEEDTAHQANEYLYLDSIKRMTYIYAEAAERINGCSRALDG